MRAPVVRADRVLMGPATIYQAMPTWQQVGTTTAHVEYRRAGEWPYVTYTTTTGDGYTVVSDEQQRWNITCGSNAITFTTMPAGTAADPTGILRRPEEQMRAREQRCAEQRTEIERLTAEREAAFARADALLRSQLDPAQLESYQRGDGIPVVGSGGGSFVIHSGSMTGNVEILGEHGRRMAMVCAHPSGSLPLPDVHLAQMIALMVDERAFVQRANLFEGTMPRYGPDGRIVDPTRDAPTACEWELPGEGPVVVSAPVDAA